MSRTLAVSSLMLVGVWLTLGGPATGQVLDGSMPNASYTPLHAWYDVNQSLDAWEVRGDVHEDEYLVDVRDTVTGSVPDRGDTYGTNVETWAQIWGNDTDGWTDRVGGFTGTQNGMTTWEVRNASGWDDTGGWTDNDGVGTGGIGTTTGSYTIFMVMNIHSTERYNGGWNVDPGDPLQDTSILNGVKSAFDADPTTGSEPGKGLLWIDAERDGENGPVWVLDAGTTDQEVVTGPVTLDEWQVHSFVMVDFDDLEVSGISRHYVNGELLGEGEAGWDPMTNLQLWSTNGGWHRAANLDFAEGIFYDEAVRGTDREGIEQYLYDKWVASSAVPGDFDEDGDVDGDDFLVWQQGFGTIYNGDDFLIWQQNFPYPGGGQGAGAVPEPASAVLALFAALAMAAITRRR